MVRVIKIKIGGRAVGTDAPTVVDWLGQISDYLDILQGVEDALASDGQRAIDWRIVDARRQSPPEIDIAAFPRQHAVNIDRRVALVVAATAGGLQELERLPARPKYFSDKLLAKAERTFERVTNGLDLSEIDFGDGVGLRITPTVARGAARNARLAQNPVDRPYVEYGTAEGFVESIARDGYNRALLILKHRLSGESVKCIVSGSALQVIGHHEIDEVFKGLRVRITGMINYKSLGRIAQIQADNLNFFPARSELPTTDEILDENFTSGLPTEEYLERLRDGRLS